MNGNKKSAKQYHQSVITALEKKVNDMKDSAYSGLYSCLLYTSIAVFTTYFGIREFRNKDI